MARADSVVRVLRVAGLALLSLLGLIAVLVAVLAFVEPARRALLSEAVGRANTALPGSITVTNARWPSLGSLATEHLLWIDDGDTLVAADRMALTVNLSALWKRSVDVENLEVSRLRLDLPELQGRFPVPESSSDTSAMTREGKADPFFPRAGSFPGAPSVRLGRLKVTSPSLRVSEDLTLVDLNAVLSIGLLAGEAPFFAVDTLRVRSRGDVPGSVENATAHADLAGPGVDMQIRATVAQEPLSLSIQTLESGRHEILLDGDGGWGLSAEAIAETEDGRLATWGVTGTIRPPSLAVLRSRPELAEHLEALPGVELPFITFDVQESPDPAYALRGRLDLGSTDWLRSGTVAVAYGAGESVLDSLSLELDGLSVSAQGRLQGESLQGDLRVRATGMGWLQVLQPEASAPDSVDLFLSGRLAGALPEPAMEATLEGGMRFGDRVVRDIQIGVRRDAGPNPVDLRIQAGSDSLWADLAGSLTLGDTLRARLSPISVTPTTPGDVAPELPGRETIRWISGSRALTVRNLRVAGALGTLAVNADWTGNTGDVEVQATWPEPPLPLARTQRSAAQDSLAALWSIHGPFSLTIRGSGSVVDGDYAADLAGDLRLPGPSTLAPLLPSGQAVTGMGPVEGEFSAEIRPGEPWPEGRLELVLSPNDWIARTEIRAQSLGGRGVLDSLIVAVPGLALHAAGWADSDSLDVDGGLRVTGLETLQPFIPAGDSLAADLTAAFHAHGSVRDPQGRLHLTGGVSAGTFSVDSLRADMNRDAGGLHGRLETLSPLGMGSLVLDRFRVGVDAPDSLNPLRFSITASGPEVSLHQAGSFNRGPVSSVQVDSLRFTIGARDLRAERPFRLRFEGPVQTLEDLSLVGSLGTVHAEARIAPDTMRVQASARLELPEQPAMLNMLPTALWPGALESSVEVSGPDSVRFEGAVRGLALPEQPPLSLELSGSGSAGGFQARGRILQSDTERGVVTVRIPARFSLRPWRFEPSGKDMTVRLNLSEMPLPLLLPSGPPQWASAQGELAAAGSLAQPEAAGSFTVTFPKIPALAEETIEASFFLRNTETPAPAVTALWPGAEARSTPGAQLALTVSRNQQPLFATTAEADLTLSALDPQVSENTPIRARITSEGFPLSRMNPFLPGSTSLEGTSIMDVSFDGPADNPALAGRLELRNVAVSLADGSKASLRGDMNFGGTAREPQVEGRVRVEGGIIRIPEQQRDVLPVDGEAELWNLESFQAPRAFLDSAQAPAEPPVVNLDVTVSIPSGLWIQGRGLSVELAGDLRLVQKGPNPSVSGELSVTRGDLIFLGRRFVVTRGVVTFYGGDVIDPQMNLVLSAQVSGESIRILFQGSAQDPELVLESDSGLNEGDIMALILFGAPLDELDAGQTENLAGEVAKSIAASKLEGRLAGRLGVDMITIRKGRSDQESLIVGKYLTRRALLKYDQALRSTSTFFLNLEYILTQSLRLETLYGSNQESGVELNWTKDY